MTDCASTIFRTGLGWVGVAASKKGVRAVVLPRRSREAALRELGGCRREQTDAAAVRALLRRAERLLRLFFSGVPAKWDIPLDVSGHTPFQQAVWRAARAIPAGETRSYGWIAGRIGRPGAARAVGRAMGANPVPVAVP